MKLFKNSDRLNLIEALNLRFKDIAKKGGVAIDYTAGDGIAISDDNVISNTREGEKYTAGDNVTISDDNVISATNTTYTAGDGIAISSAGVITNSSPGKTYIGSNGVTVNGSSITGSYKGSNGVTVSGSTISGSYKAGDNVTITNGTIYAKDTAYTAGSGINISSDYVISAEGDTSGNFASYVQTNVGGSITSAGGTLTDAVSGYALITPYFAYIHAIFELTNTTVIPAGTLNSAIIKAPYDSAAPIELPDTWTSNEIDPIGWNVKSSGTTTQQWEVSIDTTYNEIRLEHNNLLNFTDFTNSEVTLDFIVPINPQD